MVHYEEDFKCEMERIGIKEIRGRTQDILTRERHKLIKEFNQDTSIITRKADKVMYVLLWEGILSKQDKWCTKVQQNLYRSYKWP